MKTGNQAEQIEYTLPLNSMVLRDNDRMLYALVDRAERTKKAGRPTRSRIGPPA